MENRNTAPSSFWCCSNCTGYNLYQAVGKERWLRSLVWYLVLPLPEVHLQLYLCVEEIVKSKYTRNVCALQQECIYGCVTKFLWLAAWMMIKYILSLMHSCIIWDCWGYYLPAGFEMILGSRRPGGSFGVLTTALALAFIYHYLAPVAFALVWRC